jgi:hypothetical protein
LFLPKHIFGRVEAEAIARRQDEVENESQIADVIGGEQLEGELAMLQKFLEDFKKGPDYQQYLKEKEEYVKYIENEMQQIQNLKKTAPPKNPAPAQCKNCVSPVQSRAVIALQGSTSGKEEGSATKVQASKPRATTSQVAENKRLRAENKTKKEAEDSRNKSEKRRRWEALDKILLDGLKRDHADKRARLR